MREDQRRPDCADAIGKRRSGRIKIAKAALGADAGRAQEAGCHDQIGDLAPMSAAACLTLSSCVLSITPGVASSILASRRASAYTTSKRSGGYQLRDERGANSARRADNDRAAAQ